MARIFISYSSKDASLVERIATDLRQAGADVWLAKWDIGVGDDIRVEIERGIESCEFFLIALSEHSVNSRWVQHELTAGLVRHIEGLETRLLPVKLSECRIPLLIAGKKYADFSSSYENGLTTLLDAIGSVQCNDKSSEIARVFLARRGEVTKKGSPIMYGHLGTGPDLVIHWLLESVGNLDSALQASHTVFQVVANTCRDTLSSGKDFLIRQYPTMFMTFIYALADFALKHTPIEGKYDLGTKATIAIKTGTVVHVSRLGACSGVSRWSDENADVKNLWQIIAPSGRFSFIRILERNLDVAVAAPLGHIEMDDAMVKYALQQFLLQKPSDTIGNLALETNSYHLNKSSDFVALTSFELPQSDADIRRVISRIGDEDGCQAASRICEFRRHRASDCACVLFK